MYTWQRVTNLAGIQTVGECFDTEDTCIEKDIGRKAEDYARLTILHFCLARNEDEHGALSES